MKPRPLTTWRLRLAMRYSGGPGSGTIYEAVYAEEERLAEAVAARGAYTTAKAAADKAAETRDMALYEDFVPIFAGFDENGGARTFEIYERKELLGDDPDYH